MTRLPVITLLILGLALGACRRRPKAPESAAPVPATEQSSQSSVATAPAPSSDPAIAQPPTAKAAYATQADIDAYNKVLAEYCYRVSDIPTDLTDLKNRRGLPPLPVPPPGRRLAYRPDLRLMEIKTAFIRVE